MRVVACNFCGSDQYEERRIEYPYSHQGKYLLVPNTPVEICRNCGMVHSMLPVLEKIEQLSSQSVKTWKHPIAILQNAAQGMPVEVKGGPVRYLLLILQ